MRKAKTRTTTAKTKATRTTTNATRTRKKATSRKPTSRKAPAEHTLNPGGVIDLESRLLEKGNARAIAKSLKRAAEAGPSKNNPFHSALAAVNAMISHLEMQKARLEAAKKELRALYGEGDNNGEAEHQEPHPPQEFGRERNRPKSARDRRRNLDTRTRSRPTKIV